MLKSILNVHGASDNYLSCSKRACPTWLDSYIYKFKMQRPLTKYFIKNEFWATQL